MRHPNEIDLRPDEEFGKILDEAQQRDEVQGTALEHERVVWLQWQRQADEPNQG